MVNPRSPGLPKQAVSHWKVLIVDDKPDNLTLAKTALKYYGAEVHTATNGEEALEALKSLRPTVILLDIRMPKMDGWATFKSVRENPEIADTPIVAITAYAMDSDEEQIMKAGFDGYISKPFNMLTFVSQIEKFVVKAIDKQPKSGSTS
jgi:two-component system, cell cycle response regulator DivK